MDILKLLEYGATGVLVVLVYFTFLLIKQEQQRKEPREKMFMVIKAFGVMCTVIAIIAIGISIYQYESEKVGNVQKCLHGDI